MTLDEKAGMMLIDSLSPASGGAVAPPAEDYIRNQKMTRFIFRSVVTANPVESAGRGRPGAAADGRGEAGRRIRRPRGPGRAGRRPGDARAGRDVDEHASRNWPSRRASASR